MAKGLKQMVDRGKFAMYEREDLSHSIIQKNVTAAESKRDVAASPVDGDMDMTSVAERMGRIIQVGKFIDILKQLNPELIFQISKGDPSKYGVYLPEWTAAPLTGLPALSTPRFICGMESGINLGGRINEGVMSEFSIIVAEDQVIPDGNTIKKVKKFAREIRGWRTVLAALYLDGAISEAQIEAKFRVSDGKDSQNWQKRVHPGISSSSSPNRSNTKFLRG